MVAAYLRIELTEESRIMGPCGLQFAQSCSHLGTKAEHMTPAGPISVVYSLGPVIGSEMAT